MKTISDCPDLIRSVYEWCIDHGAELTGFQVGLIQEPPALCVTLFGEHAATARNYPFRELDAIATASGLELHVTHLGPELEAMRGQLRLD